MGHDQSSPKGKYITINAYIKKREISQINNPTLQLKKLEKRQTIPKATRRNEIMIFYYFIYLYKQRYVNRKT